MRKLSLNLLNLAIATVALMASISCSNSGSSKNTDAPVLLADSTGSESTTKEVGAEAEKCLYAIYYDKSVNDHPNDAPGYSRAMLKKFKELGITKGIESPYSKSFSAVLDELSTIADEVMDKTGDLVGFDGDILWDSQGEVSDFNIDVIDITVKDPDHVTLKTKFTNFDTKERVYSMVRENGVFKIDNMDDCRESAKKEIESSKQYLKEYSAKHQSSTMQNADVYVGNIGKFPIKMWLYEDESRRYYNDGIANHIPYAGYYVYLNSSGTKLQLKGEFTGVYGISLSEYTPKGRNSGEFSLQADDYGPGLHGTFKNLTNGKEFEVRLKPVE